MRRTHVKFCAAILLLSSCAGTSSDNAKSPPSLVGFGVKTSYDPAAKFPQSGNFDFFRVSVPDGTRLDAREVEARVQQAAIEEFATKGYTHTIPTI